MTLKINLSSLSNAVSKLASEAEAVSSTALVSGKVGYLSAFSTVSGLDQLGTGHSRVINGGVGAANTVLTSYAEQIEWLSAALRASGEALSGQDELFARGMDIADTGGKVVEESVMFPARPTPRFESFVFNPPVVRPSMSLDALCSQFSGTNSGAVLEAQGSWNSMASAISDVSATLSSIAGDLLAENAGDTFEQAAARINEVSAAGATFAANARMMGASVGTLNRIYMGHRMQVFMAATSIKAILDPIKRAAAERAFLASFQATFQADVLTGVPPVSNLMQMKGANGAAGDIALGMGDIAGSGKAWSAAGLTPAGASQLASAVQDAAAQVGAGSFATVADQVEGIDIGDMLTAAASAGQNLSGGAGMSASSVSPMSQSISGGSGFGSQAGMIGGPAPGMIGSTNSGRMSPAGSGIKSDSLIGARTHGASAVGGGVAPMMGGAGGVTGVGTAGSQSKNTRQTGPSVGSSSQSGAGMGMAGAGGGKASTSNFGRGVMPMMPMGGAGGAGAGQKNTGKVKSVTSAVEEDRNIAALLGDRGPVVPGVIGDWVRG
ncbi:hypothetical protein N24_2371 [Corynebacterium suranareeae]|uniref:Uncharacterized protein n=1 Tax=Corynebacterium suranareeae TaxID=2506452 RepID=A0A160PTM9_9CORY|nr:hypothetical protein [Corynebacterium suranareeae]BAU96633.1 hypothetical protein N24_2371 [Corynebacterium suranareeae]